MPSSSDQPSSYENPAVDPALYPREELPRKRSPGRKGPGKRNRKYEVVGENAEEKRSSGAAAAQSMYVKIRLTNNHQRATVVC